MNIHNKIRKLHETNAAIPGKVYHIGGEIKRMEPYIDTSNMHEIRRFGWFEYTFDHTGKGLNVRPLYEVMYDYKITPDQKQEFNQRCTDLFELGFIWSDGSGTFHLLGVWSAYWEQVNKNSDWPGYLSAVKEAIKEKENEVS